MVNCERMAEVYDQWPGAPQNTDAVVACLTCLAGRGPILELGIGTGHLVLSTVRSQQFLLDRTPRNEYRRAILQVQIRRKGDLLRQRHLSAKMG
jgi:hypothetical protein